MIDGLRTHYLKLSLLSNILMICILNDHKVGRIFSFVELGCGCMYKCMHRLLYSSTSDCYLHLFGNLALALSATSINLPASLNILVQMRGHSKTIVFKFYTGPQSLLWHLNRNKKNFKWQENKREKRKKDLGLLLTHRTLSTQLLLSSELVGLLNDLNWKMSDIELYKQFTQTTLGERFIPGYGTPRSSEHVFRGPPASF